MATVPLIEYEDASPDVRAVYDDIRATRGSDFINNFWKGLANDPDVLRETWERLKSVMGPGDLDPLTKELIYVAVSVANGCSYCIHSHTAAARARGLSDAQYGEFLSVVGMAQTTNALVTSMQIDVDEAFRR